MSETFPPYPNFPTDPERIEEVRRRIEAIPRGLTFYDILEQDPEMVAVLKTDVVRRALNHNALLSAEKRRPEAEVISYEEWVFTSIAGI